MSKAFALIVLVAALLSPIGAQDGTVHATGIGLKRPVFGAACRLCPWGAMGQVVKDAMHFYGYDVQICHNCNAAAAPIIVSEARRPPAYRKDPAVSVAMAPPNRPGLGPVDFGATAVQFLCSAYNGIGIYANRKPMKNLRLIAHPVPMVSRGCGARRHWYYRSFPAPPETWFGQNLRRAQ
ncbi:MAG: hypothetical protein ACRD25_07580 [Terracidiphilus sp.]